MAIREEAIPLPDGTAIRRTFTGEGTLEYEDELYPSDKAILKERARERRAELLDKLKHPMRTMVELYIDGDDSATEAGSQETLLHDTISGWRDQYEETSRAA